MKYRVNLFPEELKPKLDLFTLNFVFTLWGLLLGGMVVANVYYQKEYDAAQLSTLATQQEYKAKTKMHQTLIQARENRKQDPKLLERVQELQKEEHDKYWLLTELQGRERLKNQGFSLLMKDLSNTHVRDVWLTRIVVNEDKVKMEGAALDSANVPKWVNKLKESDYFSGRSFAGARLYRNEDDRLNFVISSELSELSVQSELQVASELR
ncbi:PilN domain-containing protein [Alteromonas sp. a30]|uniref:PilN domain-containing protein n=1 Tax=Alteromonas sp. a30 TaxID=2730917 RepID=UPI002282CEA2|nr:PilN domain-containing protein [Alteromonas sp. a30]MCY7295279.1 PilN domain-containing protein [Alteromonas sp. a30]